MVQIFSIPAFFIVLREVLEACLVVGIVLAYLNKIGATQYRKWVWIGAAGGIAGSVAVGLGLGIAFWISGEQGFQGKAEKIFEGVAFLVAAGLLTWMIIWMMAMGKKLRSHMEQKLDTIIESDESDNKRRLSIFLMVFIQVLREGIETVIFLIGTANADDVGGWKAIPLAGILAIIVGLAASYLVFKGLLTLDIVKFFTISGLVLIAFAAGLVSHAFHEFQEVDAFGPWDPTETRDWYNFPLWSTEGCCDDGDNEFFGMLRALFGYQDKPTFVEWATYFGYWLIVFVIFAVMNWSLIRASRSKVASYTRSFVLSSLVITFVGFVYSLMNVTWIGTLSMTLAFILSIVAVLATFDVAIRMLNFVRPLRRVLSLGSGIAFALLMAFMFVMHLVEMECIGGEDCSLNLFFFFGLIYDGDFLERGREESQWPPLAALSWSIVLTVYFFGGLSLLLILFSMNVNEDGTYLDDNAVLVKETEDEEHGLQPSDEQVPAPVVAAAL